MANNDDEEREDLVRESTRLRAREKARAGVERK